MKFIAQSALFALLLLVGANLAAQDTRPEAGHDRTPPDPAKMADRQTERMAKTVNLSTDQRAQVQAINLKYAQQHQQARPPKPAEGTGATPPAKPTEAERQAMHEKMKAVRDQQDAELKAVLTPEQWATWEKDRAEHKGKHGGKGKKTKKA